LHRKDSILGAILTSVQPEKDYATRQLFVAGSGQAYPADETENSNLQPGP
jgi:hypothetical protein